MFARLFAAVGLVRAARLAALEQQLRKSEARATKVNETIELTRAEAREWKVKFGEADKRAKEFEREAARQMERVDKIKSDLGAQLETERRRLAEFQAMRTRLADAEREIAVARDHLMAIEVKLDILEGAANVLDNRTRTAPAAAAKRESGAPV